MANADDASTSGRQIPDWAPWVVLGGLSIIGVLGGLGLVPLSFKAKVATAQPTLVVLPKGSSAPAQAPELPPLPSDRPKSWAEAKSGDKISVWHLVVTFEGTPLATNRGIHRTQGQALARAREAVSRARKGENFEQLVAEYSDEPPTSPTKGRIEGFTRGLALKSFGDAAFALKPGEFSEPVLTSLGYHVIERTK
jgi:hypothetical protein